MEELLKSLSQFALSSGIKIVLAAVTLFIGLKLVKLIIKAIFKLPGAKKLDASVSTFLKSFLSAALKIVVIISAAGILGIPLASVTAIIASCGVAIGLALQGGLSNLAGGIIILIMKPFRVNDFISVNGFDGSVESVGLFYTTLITPDNKKIMMPNGALMNSTITAVNQLDTRRVDLDFSIAYDSDIDFARKVIAETAKGNSLILDDPATQIIVSKQGDSAVTMTLRAWVKTENYWDVYFDINEKTKKAFNNNGITIPFPQMDVHVKND